jgi:hypothetical protein
MAIVYIFAIVIGLPIVLGLAFEVYKRQMTFKERQLELTADRTAEKAAQYAAQVERLEERMRVIERITTDSGVAVAQQIESLRDKPSVRLAKPEEELN